MKRKKDVRIVPPCCSAQEWEKLTKEMRLPHQAANVTALILQARADKNIATELRIATATVRDYIKIAFARTGVEGRVNLVMRVVQMRDEPRRKVA